MALQFENCFTKSSLFRAASSTVCLLKGFSMRCSNILFVIGLLFCLPATASEVTWENLCDWADNPLISHETKLGTIVCRDPQIEFNESEWLTDNARGRSKGGSLREHMLIDTMLNKRLLHKTKIQIDALFPSGSFKNGIDSARYGVFRRSSGCGAGPNLVIEIVYNNEQQVVKYRVVIQEDCKPTPTESNWAE